jgi:hypothetical protein
MKYKIIHLIGIKIECITDVIKYLDEYGHPNYEILEEHSNIYIASRREIDLQNQYGYINAKKSFFYNLFWGEEGQRIKHYLDGTCKTSDYRLNKYSKENKLLSRGGTRSCAIVNECPKCGKKVKGPAYYRHIRKC